MKIPKTIWEKINTIDSLRSQQMKLESEVLKWFESKGYSTDDEKFADEVAAKISYGEFNEDAWKLYLSMK